MPEQPNRFGVQCHVSRTVMCASAPYAVQDMMHEFVRNVSPDWSTVRMEIVADSHLDNWIMRLDGRGIARG